MLPDNIDLTEHRDFGEGFRNFFIDEITSISAHEQIYELIDSPFVSIEQCNLITAWEGVFGKRHRNEWFDIFKWDFHKHDGCCVRCGKPIVPWGENELCKECNNGLEKQLRPFPWYVAGADPWRPADDRGQDNLFNLR